MSRQQITASTSGCNGSVKLAVFAALAVALTILTLASAAYAQTFVTLHDFARGTDGGYPYAGLTIDRAGNLYGTASQGGNLNACYHSGCGTVFKLEHKPSGWIYSVLYAFSGPDGQYPETRVSFAPDGSLYGTTSVGGPSGYGEVFRLQPPLRPCRSVSCPWRETLVHSFSGGSDGAYPTYGDLAFDHAGNIYGTTPYGGDPNCGGGSGCGVVYKLSPSSGGWTETILYAFHNGNDGGTPFAGVVFDSSGNIYGTNSAGVVYELSPAAGGWVETTLTNLCSCFGGLTFDSAGNLYGVSFLNFENGGPGVFELSPSNGGWRIQGTV